MSKDEGTRMKTRLRADLMAAMKREHLVAKRNRLALQKCGENKSLDRFHVSVKNGNALGMKREAIVLRELIAAIDNAEAAPLHPEESSAVRHDFLSGSAEVERLFLDRDQVRAILLREIKKRAEAAAEFERLGAVENAEALHAEILVARRYVDR